MLFSQSLIHQKLLRNRGENHTEPKQPDPTRKNVGANAEKPYE
jgi:hypothetical protein